MVGGRLVLTGYGGGVNAIDPATAGAPRAEPAAGADCGPVVDNLGHAAGISWTGGIDRPRPAALA